MKTMKQLAIPALFVAAIFVASTLSASAQSAIGTVVTLSGFVLDHSTLLPVEANYAVYDATGRNKIGQSRRANHNDGYLVTGLKPGETYVIRVEDPRYFKEEFTVALPQTAKYAEVSRDFLVRKLAAGKKLMLSPSPFDLKKTEIKDGTEEDLRAFAHVLIINPSVKIEIVCYPDEELPANRAKTISESRASSLKEFLEKAGVSADRVKIRSASTTDPLNPPPLRKGAKGKRYIGPVYVYITAV